MQSVAPQAAAIWIADKRDAFSDPEFRAILLEYDAAFEWSSDDHRLDAVADRSMRWLTAHGSRSVGEERPHDATIAQLLADNVRRIVASLGPAHRDREGAHGDWVRAWRMGTRA